MSYIIHENMIDQSPMHICATLKELVDEYGTIQLLVTLKSGKTIEATLTRPKFYSSIFFQKYTQSLAA